MNSAKDTVPNIARVVAKRFGNVRKMHEATGYAQNTIWSWIRHGKTVPESERPHIIKCAAKCGADVTPYTFIEHLISAKG